ncbi:MAG: porin [Chitinophagaceae bacterium]|nr:porin [Chitinophagaceae bacterium]
MKRFILIIAASLFINAQAQDTVKAIAISGYVEGYYSYDFNKPANNTRPGFLYNYSRHNEVNINLGFVKANYTTERIRANLAIAVGTYMNVNYSAEPGTLKNIYEANAGYKLSAKKNLWLDIGIMPSHIGFESAIGKDNWSATRSLVAENSPYFESGAKLSYTTDNGKVSISALALNGWQRITRVDGNSLMSWGTQFVYKPGGNLTLNYSTFIGTDKPDSARLWRYYHNIYGIWQINNKLGLTVGFDIGSEQKNKSDKAMNTWYTPISIVRFTPNNKWAVAYRIEYFSDKNGVIIVTGTPEGFATLGNSANIDYLPASNIMLRLEGRTFNSKDAIFIKNGTVRSVNNAVTFTTSIYF